MSLIPPRERRRRILGMRVFGIWVVKLQLLNDSRLGKGVLILGRRFLLCILDLREDLDVVARYCHKLEPPIMEFRPNFWLPAVIVKWQLKLQLFTDIYFENLYVIQFEATSSRTKRSRHGCVLASTLETSLSLHSPLRPHSTASHVQTRSRTQSS